MKFVITFPVGGPLADHYCTLTAHDELSARLALVAVYGQRGWSGIYPAGVETQAMVLEHDLHPVDFGFGREIAQEYVA